MERWLDTLIGRRGRKILEQVGHAAMAGVPAFLVANWLPISDQLQVVVAVVFGLSLGITREYFQNVGDPPDEDTLFSIGRLPINLDMIVDLSAYAVGTGLAALLALSV